MNAPWLYALVFMARSAALLLLLACALGCSSSRVPRLEDLNVVLIVIDTLGAEHLGYMGEPRAHTPHLDRLAREGVDFRRAYSTAPWTQPSIASLFTSKMPFEHGVIQLFDALAPEHPTLPEMLARRGLETGGVISHDLIRRRFGFARGFVHYDESPIGGHEGITSHRVTDLALRWLDDRAGNAPFFLFVHYFDPHYVYHHHPQFDQTSWYRGRLLPAMDIWELRDMRDDLVPDDIAYLKGLYREEIAFTDAHVGRLVEGLRERGLAGRTIVIVTSDHGEEFMQRGWIGHTRTLFEELLHVPLIISLPGVFTPREVEDPVSILDVVPTLLELSSEPPPGDAFEGRSLLPYLLGGDPEPAPRDIFAEVSFGLAGGQQETPDEHVAFKTALVRGDHKVIHDLLAKEWQLFDLAADPEERHTVFAEAPLAAGLKSDLLAWESQRGDQAARPGAIVPSEEEIERLRALGYLR